MKNLKIFCVNFDLLLSNKNEEIPICSIIIGDFNARISNWWKNDITNSVGQELDSLTSSAGYSQIIDKATHIVNNSMSCIDFIFCPCGTPELIFIRVDKNQLRSSTRIGTSTSFISLIYIDDLPDGITSICKIFADDTSKNINRSVNELNCDLEKVSNWAYQWKMQFNPDPNKQANEVIFSRKSNSNSFPYPPVKFNENNITKCSYQKHLGIVLDLKLNCNTHIDQKIKKCNKLIGLMKRLSVNLPRSALLTIYKSFIRPHLEYGDILYDKPDNESFQNKIEKVQYKACLAITGAIQGTSREKLYEELGLHSLVERRRSNKLILFYKIVNGLVLLYKWFNLYSYLNFTS